MRRVPPELTNPVADERTPFSPTSPGSYLSPTVPGGGRRWPSRGDGFGDSASISSSDDSIQVSRHEQDSVLLLFWPKFAIAENRLQEKWILGWNPQGLVIVVAGFVEAKSFMDCEEMLVSFRQQVARDVEARLKLVREREVSLFGGASAKQQQSPAENTSPIYDDIAQLEERLRLVKFLKVVGRLNNDSKNEPEPDVGEGDYLARRRREADVWMELSCELGVKNGHQMGLPLMRELLCCSYRHSASLHVIGFEPNHQYSTQPVPMTALSLLPDAGLSQFQCVLDDKATATVESCRSSILSVESDEDPQLTASVLSTLERQRKRGFILAPGAISFLEGKFIDHHTRHVLGLDEETPKSLPRCVVLTNEMRGENKHMDGSSFQEGEDGFFATSPNKEALREDEGDSDGSNSVRRHSLTSHPGNESIITNDSVLSNYGPHHGALSADNYLCHSQGLILNLKGETVSSETCAQTFLNVKSVLYAMFTMPPRLVFKYKEDTEAFGIIVACCNHSKWLQKHLVPQNEGVASTLESDAVTYLDLALQKCDPLLGILQQGITFVLPAVERLVGYSYLARFVEFRLQMILNGVSIARGHSHHCGLHPGLPHSLTGTSKCQRTTCLVGFLLQVVFDCALGIIATTLLIRYEAVFLSLFRSFAWHGLHDLHIGYLEWFIGWPAGFKMNDDLNVLLAAFSNGVLEGWRRLVYLSPDLRWLEFALPSVCLLSLFGLSFGLCLVADYCNICTLHLRNAFHVFKVVYRGFVGLLASLIKQFQGRRFNPLKKRVDMGSFDHDQMLLGTLIATAGIFLFPTLAMYYFYFAFVRTSVWVVQESLCGVSFTISFLPLGQVISWWFNRNATTCGVNFSDAKVDVVSGVPVVSMLMEGKPMKFGEALHDFKYVVRTCLRPLTPGRLASFIISATHKPAINPRGTIYGHLVGSRGEPFLPNLSVVYPTQESSSS